MARRWKISDDANSDATIINNYAVFMGYLSMGIKGLGFLILTWTTVVLLGGFVSALQKKDFWCLTFITLVQTAGIFDVILNEKLSYILYSARGLLVGSISSIVSYDDMKKAKKTVYGFVVYVMRLLLAFVCVVVQMLVLAILLCPLAAVYVSGLLISTGISLWRLIEHDYGGNSDEQANLKSAMDTLYSIALLQGVLFLYRFIFARAGKRVAKNLIHTCGDNEQKAILTYLRETQIGCEKNPSFARGRNFITHAVDLIGSKSRNDCLSGVQLLYTAICIGERRLKQGIELISQQPDDFLLYISLCGGRRIRKKKQKFNGMKIIEEIIGEHMLMKTLIMSESSSPLLKKVLLQLNPQSTYDRKVRYQAARIVAYFALDIHLEQFPRGIQYISTLIGTFEEHRLIESHHKDRLIHKYHQDCDRQDEDIVEDEDELREAYEKLVLRGLCIFRKLAAHENNCRIMIETRGLVPRIMAPLTSDLIHQFDDGAWSVSIVEGSMKVLRLLVAAPGEIGATMRQEISNNKEVVSTMERIVNCECDYCHVKLQKQAMWILIQLYMDTMSRLTFIKMLVDIFAAGDNRDMSIRKLAGEALTKLCFQSGSNTAIILQLDGDVVGSLTNILLDAEKKTCRIRAAEILEHMCLHYTQDDKCTAKKEELKKVMTYAMPKVLAELTKDEAHARKKPGKKGHASEEVDIENQYKENETSSSTHPRYKENKWEVDEEEDESDNEEDEDFHAPLLSLCVTVCDTLITADEDLACQFETSLPKMLLKIVGTTPTVRWLKRMKLTSRMVISMMKHSGNYDKEDLDSLIDVLTRASRIMCHLDMSMVFAGEDDGATTMKPFRSLHSLVIEAKESAETRTATKAHQLENIMEPSTSGPPPTDDID